MNDSPVDNSLQGAKSKNSDRVAIVLFGVLLVFWPFVMFGLAFCDDDRAFICRDPMYGYTVLSSFAYPFLFLVALIWGSKLKRAGAKSSKVMAVSCVPLISAYPWLLIYLAFAFS